ncbi:MAG: alpha-L-glutamate ligase-like protein [Woeseiaceae bacterium]
MFAVARKLHDVGVLGLNERNADYIARLNPRRLYPLVDDKVVTKELALKAGMAVPDLYGVIAHQGEVRKFSEIVSKRESFVIKPARGSGGDGILVVTGRSKRKRDTFRLSNGVFVSEGEIRHHISNTVSGQYSLSGSRDAALIEYCVHFDPTFAEISYQGVPDIRVIVYRGYPVMAMVRLPTRASDGKANLHQGAVGAGVDLCEGKTLTGVLGNEIVDEHPDTGALIAGLEIPMWDFILESSARGYDVTGLGYLGVDMVIDNDRGPLILEMNARPGLNIQIANRAGLSERIARVEANYDSAASPSERAAVARREFAAGESRQLDLI